MHIFRFVFLIFAPLLSQNNEIKIQTLDSIQIKLSLDSLLTRQNSLIILENKILFKNPSIFSKPIVKLKEGRLLIITKCKYNWCKVKTEKYFGWLKTKNVWGNVD